MRSRSMVTCNLIRMSYSLSLNSRALAIWNDVNKKDSDSLSAEEQENNDDGDDDDQGGHGLSMITISNEIRRELQLFDAVINNVFDSDDDDDNDDNEEPGHGNEVSALNNIIFLMEHTKKSLPFDFENKETVSIVQKSYSDSLNSNKKQSYRLNAIAKIGTAAAILTGAGTMLSKYVNKLRFPAFGSRIRRISRMPATIYQPKAVKKFVTANTLSLVKKSTVDLARVLSQYHEYLRNAAIGSYIALSTTYDNTALQNTLLRTQGELESARNFNGVLQKINENNLREIAKLESLNRKYLSDISTNHRLMTDLQDVYREEHAAYLEMHQMMVKCRDRMNYLSRQLYGTNLAANKEWDTVQFREIIARATANYVRANGFTISDLPTTTHARVYANRSVTNQGNMFNVNPRARNGWGIHDQGNTFNFNTHTRNDLGIINQGTMPGSNHGHEPNWFDALISHAIGIVTGIVGTSSYHETEKKNIIDKLFRSDLHNTFLKNENDAIANYASHVQESASFNMMQTRWRKKYLLGKISEYEANKRMLEETVDNLKKSIELQKKAHETKVDEIRQELSDKLKKSETGADLFKTRVDAFESSLRDLEALRAAENNFENLKQFAKTIGIISGSTETMARIFYDPARNVYGYKIKPNYTQEHANKIRYLDILEVLIRNGAYDNLYKLYESKDYNEFMRSVDLSGNLLNSVILRPPSNNPIALATNLGEKSLLYIDNIHGFFKKHATHIAIGAGVAALFTITTGYISALTMLKYLGTYMARFILNSNDKASTNDMQDLIIDALLWGMKMALKDSVHNSSKLFGRIVDMANGSTGLALSSIDPNDPMMNNVTTYITNVMRGNPRPVDPYVVLPFDAKQLKNQLHKTRDTDTDNKIDDALTAFKNNMPRPIF